MPKKKAAYWTKLMRLNDNSQAQIARSLGVSRALVNVWWKQGYIPEKRSIEIERATQGLVSSMEVLVEADRIRRLG